MTTGLVARNLCLMTTTKITATQAAELVGVTRQSIHRWVKEGRLKPVEVFSAQNIGLYHPEDVLDAAGKRPEAPAELPRSKARDQRRAAADDAFLEFGDAFYLGWTGAHPGPIEPRSAEGAAYTLGSRAYAENKGTR